MVRWLKRIALLVIVLAVVLAITAWWALRASLPVLDGEQPLAGLSAPVSIQRDALGVVTIDATSETDAMRALGYVHAQERYFEMDLMRRTAAGELAALFGPVATETDKRHRVHRMRARVMENLDSIAGERLPQLRAYAEGVNAGLAGLDARPWPYLLLRQQPEPWMPADSALTGYAMYFDLQDSTNARELALWRMRPHLPPALYALLARDGTRWDAPLAGKPRGDAMLPGADEVDLRALPMPDLESARDSRALALTPPPASRAVPLSPARRERGIGGPPAATDFYPGSNNFAVSGALTRDGRAIVADDMHLGLRAPNIWFRARLRYPDPRAPDGQVDVQGFTLPGLPAVIVGGNGHVAWGFTNSYVDTMDWAEVRPCPASGGGGRCQPATIHREAIQVAGADDASLDVTSVAWGPILHEDAGSALALRWTAHLPGSLNFGIADLARARDIEEVRRIADRSALPTQNLVAGDRHGNIVWRLIGPLPGRGRGCSAGTLVETATGARGVHKPIATDQDHATPAAAPGTDAMACPPWGVVIDAAPMLLQPAAGRLWTANNRLVDGAALRRVGDAGYALAARARQIRDSLFARQRFTEQDLLAIQLDDRALFLAPWWRLLQDTAESAGTTALSELANAAKIWQGRASPDSTSYRIIRAWRLAVHARIADGLTAPAQAALGEAFEMPNLPQFEGVAWPLVIERPAHLLPRRFASWDALFEDAAREVNDVLSQHGPLARRTWGERNTARICHPLAGAVPLLGKRMLCMPPDELSGDGNMPRVAAPAFGASQRMVVSPGHEADGIIHMPGGQSGHPLSPFWGAGHADWVRGRATPFLPGKTEYTLRLEPLKTGS